MANICIFSFFFVKIITKLTGSPFRGEESKLWHSDNNDKHAGLRLHPANNEGRLYSLKSCSTVYGHTSLNVPDLIGNHTVWKTYIHLSSIFKLSYFSSFFPNIMITWFLSILIYSPVLKHSSFYAMPILASFWSVITWFLINFLEKIVVLR